MSNQDTRTVDGFGDEWRRFDQRGVADAELSHAVRVVLRGVPVGRRCPSAPSASTSAAAADDGPGWSRRGSGRLHASMPRAEALAVARRNLAHAAPTATLYHGRGRRHPARRRQHGLRLLARRAAPRPRHRPRPPRLRRQAQAGAPFLLYLYYALRQPPVVVPRSLARVGPRAPRRVASAVPGPLRRQPGSRRRWSTGPWPAARRVLERAGLDVSHLPLSAYRDRSFYVMRNDALDRFGTRLEQRFTRAEITALMASAGLDHIVFSDRVPFWCAVGRRARKGGRSTGSQEVRLQPDREYLTKPEPGERRRPRSSPRQPPTPLA